MFLFHDELVYTEMFPSKPYKMESYDKENQEKMIKNKNKWILDNMDKLTEEESILHALSIDYGTQSISSFAPVNHPVSTPNDPLPKESPTPTLTPAISFYVDYPDDDIPNQPPNMNRIHRKRIPLDK